MQEIQSISGTVCERVTEAIRDDIVSGELPPEARLKISMLTDRYGVSAAPVREALQQLQSEGLISTVPNRGAFVRRISAVEFVYLMDVRGAVEGLQARKCAESVTPRLVKDLERAAAGFEDATSAGYSKRVSEWNAKFHDLIAKHDGNWVADEIITRVRRITAALRRQYRLSPERLERACAEHRQMLDAIQAGDAATAESCARAHVAATKEDILSLIGDYPEDTGQAPQAQ